MGGEGRARRGKVMGTKEGRGIVGEDVLLLDYWCRRKNKNKEIQREIKQKDKWGGWERRGGPPLQ